MKIFCETNKQIYDTKQRCETVYGNVQLSTCEA